MQFVLYTCEHRPHYIATTLCINALWVKEHMQYMYGVNNNESHYIVWTV